MPGHDDEVRVIRADQRTAGPPTAGMDRQEAFTTETMWAGYARTKPGMMSGWHHHGDYESAIYVLSGSLHMEFGPSGTQTVVAGPGDFVFVAKGAVHRESNPSNEPADIAVVRAGRGESNVNVDGPA